LQSPGEYVLVEEPRQPLLVDRLLSVGLDFAMVPRNADGPDLAAMRSLCQKRSPRYFFCQSVLHNPTGGHMAPHVAFQILRLAEEFNLTIIEDDTYSELLPQGVTATRLAQLDQLKRVIYVGSLSKSLAAGLRVGYLAANPERVNWLATYRILKNIANNNLAERTAYRLLSQGTYRHHCEQLRSKLAELRQRVIAELRSYGFVVPHEPDSGFFLWADLGKQVDTFAVAQRLLKQGHLVAPGILFSLEHSSFMRFNVTETLQSDLLPSLAKELGRHPAL
jgi:DNA-binding transcriptional MocR family regulator